LKKRSITPKFFIKQVDKSYTETTWLLPSIYIGVKLTIESVQDVTAEVKTQKN